MIITFANVKGGSGKTTGAVHLAFAIADQGKHVVVVDADGQASARRWSRKAARMQEPWPFPLEFLPTKDLIDDIDDLMLGRDYVVIDVGPANADIMLAAMSVADVVVVPANAKTDDLEQAYEAIQGATRLGKQSVVLLSRVKTAERVSVSIAREFFAAHNVPVLTAVVPDLVMYSDAFGRGHVQPGIYVQVLTELEEVCSGIEA